MGLYQNHNNIGVYCYHGKTRFPSEVKPNPFGLLNMPGNVSEFCQDWYSPDTYASYNEEIIMDPRGPAGGLEHVIRRGSFKNDAADVSCAARDFMLFFNKTIKSFQRWIITNTVTAEENF